MKIVVIGGTGLIGSKVVANLTEHGDEAVPASPSSGAPYFGTELRERALVPGAGATLGATRFEDWLARRPDDRS